LISRSFAAQPRRELVGFQIIMFADYPFSPAGLVGLPEAGGTSSGNIHCREAHQFGQDLYACHDLSILSCAPWPRSFGTSSTAFSPGVDSIDCFSQSFPRLPGETATRDREASRFSATCTTQRKFAYDQTRIAHRQFRFKAYIAAIGQPPLHRHHAASTEGIQIDYIGSSPRNTHYPSDSTSRSLPVVSSESASTQRRSLIRDRHITLEI
jgi:hypothetical protein